MGELSQTSRIVTKKSAENVKKKSTFEKKLAFFIQINRIEKCNFVDAKRTCYFVVKKN